MFLPKPITTDASKVRLELETFMALPTPPTLDRLMTGGGMPTLAFRSPSPNVKILSPGKVAEADLLRPLRHPLKHFAWTLQTARVHRSLAKLKLMVWEHVTTETFGLGANPTTFLLLCFAEVGDVNSRGF